MGHEGVGPSIRVCLLALGVLPKLPGFDWVLFAGCELPPRRFVSLRSTEVTAARQRSHTYVGREMRLTAWRLSLWI